MLPTVKVPSRLELKLKKVAYYARGFFQYFLYPDVLCRRRLEAILNEYERNGSQPIEDRVHYYNKVNDSFTLGDESISVGEFNLWTPSSTAYSLDLHEVIRYFPADKQFEFRFGDIREVPSRPTFVKSRPIEGENQNSVLLKLNKKRHYHFITDVIPFEDKSDGAVWRGRAHTDDRQRFIKTFQDHPRVNAGDVRNQARGTPVYKPYMSLDEQLEHKFIVSIEGLDVASNVKWIMSSNSLCMMPKPEYETWFMEGRLEPGKHYVQLNDDFSDLEEKMDYYLRHPDEAKAIVREANQYVEQFLNPRRERLISLFVTCKYFEKSGQNVLSG